MSASSPRSRAQLSDSDVPASPARQGDAPSTRRDARTGTSESVALRGKRGDRVFTCTHLPRERPIGALVICSPLDAEFLHNYRKEVFLARSLAATGLAVQRFHYRGAGNSERAADALSFDSMLEDTTRAADLLAEEVGAAPVAFLGTRASGAVAAAAAGRSDDAPLVLWQPTLDPDAYYRELFRAAAIRELRRDAGRSEGAHRTPASVERLRANGSVDVLGYAIHRSQYESLIAHPLAGEMSGSRPVLLVQLEREERLRPGYATFEADLRRTGHAIRTTAITAGEHWWFSGDPGDAAVTLRSVIDVTQRWLQERFETR
jgi:acetyl esterase/lipase